MKEASFEKSARLTRQKSDEALAEVKLAERKAASAKAKVRAAKSAFKSTKKGLKAARRSAKAARKELAGLAEAAEEAELAASKAEKKAAKAKRHPQQAAKMRAGANGTHFPALQAKAKTQARGIRQAPRGRVAAKPAIRSATKAVAARTGSAAGIGVGRKVPTSPRQNPHSPPVAAAIPIPVVAPATEHH